MTSSQNGGRDIISTSFVIFACLITSSFSVVQCFPWFRDVRPEFVVEDNVNVNVFQHHDHGRHERSIGDMPSNLNISFRLGQRMMNIPVERNDIFWKNMDRKSNVPDFPVFVIQDGEIKRKQIIKDRGIGFYVNESSGSSFVVRKTSNRSDFVMEGIFYDGPRRLHLSPSLSGSFHRIHGQNLVVDFMDDYLKNDNVNGDSKSNNRLQTSSPQPPGGNRQRLVSTPQTSDSIRGQPIRRGRQAGIDHQVQLFMVADNKDYRTWLKFYGHNSTLTELEMNLYYAFIANSISVRYSSVTLVDPSFRLDIIITGLLIVNSNTVSHWTDRHRLGPGSRYVEASGALESFRQWIKSARFDLPPSDHWMLFTGFDIFTERNPNVAGLAKLGGMCSLSSVSIIEQDNTGSVGATAAHELGHSLNAVHDGEEKNCFDEDNYVMSRKLKTPDDELLASRPWQFSPCSVRAFKRFVSQIKCPQRSRGLSVLSTELSPGQIFSADLQCQLALGNGSYFGRSLQIREGYPSMCRRLYCAVPGEPGLFQAIFAMEKTSCGDGKWCQRGKCVDHTEAPHMEDTCPQGNDPTAPCVREDCPYYTPRTKLVYCCSTCRNTLSIWLSLLTGRTPDLTHLVRQVDTSHVTSYPEVTTPDPPSILNTTDNTMMPTTGRIPASSLSLSFSTSLSPSSAAISSSTLSSLSPPSSTTTSFTSHLPPSSATTVSPQPSQSSSPLSSSLSSSSSSSRQLPTTGTTLSTQSQLLQSSPQISQLTTSPLWTKPSNIPGELNISTADDNNKTQKTISGFTTTTTSLTKLMMSPAPIISSSPSPLSTFYSKLTTSSSSFYHIDNAPSDITTLDVRIVQPLHNVLELQSSENSSTGNRDTASQLKSTNGTLSLGANTTNIASASGNSSISSASRNNNMAVTRTEVSTLNELVGKRLVEGPSLYNQNIDRLLFHDQNVLHTDQANHNETSNNVTSLNIILNSTAEMKTPQPFQPEVSMTTTGTITTTSLKTPVTIYESQVSSTAPESLLVVDKNKFQNSVNNKTMNANGPNIGESILSSILSDHKLTVDNETVTMDNRFDNYNGTKTNQFYRKSFLTNSHEKIDNPNGNIEKQLPLIDTERTLLKQNSALSSLNIDEPDKNVTHSDKKGPVSLSVDSMDLIRLILESSGDKPRSDPIIDSLLLNLVPDLITVVQHPQRGYSLQVGDNDKHLMPSIRKLGSPHTIDTLFKPATSYHTESRPTEFLFPSTKKPRTRNTIASQNENYMTSFIIRNLLASDDLKTASINNATAQPDSKRSLSMQVSKENDTPVLGIQHSNKFGAFNSPRTIGQRENSLTMQQRLANISPFEQYPIISPQIVRKPVSSRSLRKETRAPIRLQPILLSLGTPKKHPFGILFDTSQKRQEQSSGIPLPILGSRDSSMSRINPRKKIIDKNANVNGEFNDLRTRNISKTDQLVFETPAARTIQIGRQYRALMQSIMQRRKESAMLRAMMSTNGLSDSVLNKRKESIRTNNTGTIAGLDVNNTQYDSLNITRNSSQFDNEFPTPENGTDHVSSIHNDTTNTPETSNSKIQNVVGSDVSRSKRLQSYPSEAQKCRFGCVYFKEPTPFDDWRLLLRQLMMMSP